jgi:hypothetical protein
LPDKKFLHIVPLEPTYKAGLAGHVPAKEVSWLLHLPLISIRQLCEVTIMERNVLEKTLIGSTVR